MIDVVPIPGFFEPFGSLLHLLAAGAVVAGGTSLVRRGKDLGSRVALSMFIVAATSMLALSGTYHLLERGTVPRAVLRQLDHAAIWVMIASSFTAIHWVALRGPWRWGFLSIVWVVAISGLVLQAVFLDVMSESAILSLYLAFSWLGATSAFVLGRRLGWVGMRDLWAGGAAYTGGAIYDFARGPSPLPGIIGPHEVFHVGVVLGVVLHWRFIAELAEADPERPHD